MRRLRVAISCVPLLAALGWALPAAAEAPWRIDGHGLDAAGLDGAELAATQRLVETAAARLPPALRDGAGLPPVTIGWRDDLPGDVHGRVHGGRIVLQRALLADWMAAVADGTATPDDPRARPALAALLHELAHVHDRSPQGGLSRDPRLRDLAGWPVRPLRAGTRVRRNDFDARSPDLWELRSPAEFVAVNLEHFLLDPGYACRRPLLHAHFAAHFGWAPDAAACAPGLAYVEAVADAAPASAALLELDPARVHAVEYLLAEGNERPMSRWGHVMLRLVVCAPGRPRGPDCRLDLDHHRVLSFRAFVDDVQISSWRGLTGRYPSRLFVLPLQQVVDEYTRVELRALQSIPLRLGDDEIAALLARAAEVHWGYDGRYYFVGNNCAVETWKLLHAGVPRLGALPLRSITPNGLLRRLQRQGIADTAVLDDIGRARRLGHYFDSAASLHASMYDVARQALGLPQADAGDWLALAPARRRPWIEDVDDLRAASALLVLEEGAQRRQQLLARDELKRRLLRARGDRYDAATPDAAGATAASLQAMLAAGGELARPATLLAGVDGYGLPQAQERALLRARVDARGRALHGLGTTLEQQARPLLSRERRTALDDGEANLALLGERLRMLAREQDGSGPSGGAP
ncbi:DUF4105 domain-containing protein [Luteimonas sp. BDR2-5]|uniref:DUF7844 domain-containing protein n=1 Tax=Proluteimonas luteida TaxID=2878685 RepID=UPI001E2E1013|nr:DUF4105 domain-containing protein [Luteimonas sp. BDR2-5]MCD9027694.1 DUF4105 domain-containing protein [Luteimonas sp. BDR2-5]